MAGNTYGDVFRVTTFGESHGEASGVIIDGMIPGLSFTVEMVQKDLNRRRPGLQQIDGGTVSSAVTSRKEPDTVRILSGIFEGKTTGAPIAMIIENTNQHSGDYSNIANLFRPGHADYTFLAKYGIRDYRGGGRSSGRETAARVAAGAAAKALLAHFGIHVTAWTAEAAGIQCQTFDKNAIEHNSMRACDNEAAERMERKLAELKNAGDSAGGIICCSITGVPAGLGEPVFDKFDAELAKAVMSIGAVKGFEIGAGFDSARMTGSRWNDAFYPCPATGTNIAADSGNADTAVNSSNITADNNTGRSGFAPPASYKSNRCGGILGGITTGADIFFKAAVKPVPSIAIGQQTIDIHGNAENISVSGRHDICLCPRIVPVIEAMAAITTADMLLRNNIPQ